MSEIIERVARAMAEADGWTWSGPHSQMVDEYASGQSGSRARNWWRTAARAAIKAMREPTPLMCGFGMSPLSDALDEGRAPSTRVIWQAMIDTALGEEDG